MNELEELAARYPYTLDTIIDLHKHLGYTHTEQLLTYALHEVLTEKKLRVILHFLRTAYLKGYIGSYKNIIVDYTLVRKT